MRVVQLLDELARRDVILATDNDRLEVDAPRGVITPNIRQQLVIHKAALIAAVRARKAPSPCFACGGTDYWERPPEHGGGRVCSTCHPDLTTLGSTTREGLTEGSARSLAEGDRQKLARWALKNGCPELKFRAWAWVVGTPSGWLTFLQTASDDDVLSAFEATKSQPSSNRDIGLDGRDQRSRRGARGLFTSASCEWYTPAVIVDRAVALLGAIDLDPCSNSHEQPNVPAAEHYTRAENGLERPWRGRVYMNPPYGRAIQAWVKKLVEEYESGNVTEAVALLPARTDTRWFQLLRGRPVCLVRGRLRFSGCPNPAPFPSALAYFGRRPDAFRQAFGDLGDTWERAER